MPPVLTAPSLVELMQAITTTRTRIATGIGIAALLALLLLSPAGNAPVQAQTIATVRPEPATLALQPGAVADVAVRLENANDVYGIDVRAAFDPAIVEIVDADPDAAGVQMVAGEFPQPDLVALNTADNAAGTLRYVVTQVNPTPPATGQGVVFSFQVRARAGGATELAVTLVEMADRDGNLLAVTTGLATIQVTGPTAAPTGIILPPTPATTGAPDEATATASPVPGATATASVPTATATGPVAGATTTPAGTLSSAAPAAATVTAAGATAGATQPAPANPPAAGQATAGPEAEAATAPPVESQPTAAPSTAGGELPTTAVAGATTAPADAVPPRVIGDTAGGSTGAPAGAVPSSGPARSGLTTATLLGGVVVALLVAGIALALLRRRG